MAVDRSDAAHLRISTIYLVLAVILLVVGLYLQFDGRTVTPQKMPLSAPMRFKDLNRALMLKDAQTNHGNRCKAHLLSELPVPRARTANTYWVSDPPVAISHDSTSVAIADYEGCVRKFDIATGKLIAESRRLREWKPSFFEWKYPGLNISKLTFSPDDATLLVQSEGAQVLVLDGVSLKVRYEFAGHVASVMNDDRAHFSKDGKSFVASRWLENEPSKSKNASSWGDLILLDSRENKQNGVVAKQDESPTQYWALSPEGSKFAFIRPSTSPQGMFAHDLIVMNTDNQKVLFAVRDIAEVRGNLHGPDCVGIPKILRFNASGTALVIGYEHLFAAHGHPRMRTTFLRVVDLETGHISGRVCHLGVIDNVRVLEEYGALVSRTGARSMRVTPLSELPVDPQKARPKDNFSDVFAVLSPDGLFFAAERQANAFDLYYSANNERVPLEFEREFPPAMPRAFSHDGSLLVTFSADKVRIWKLTWQE